MSCSTQRDSAAPSRGVGRPLRSVPNRQPLILLADSRLLFPSTGGEPLLAALRGRVSTKARAVYLGASNGDVADFFDLFRAAMGGIGITDCHHCAAPPAAKDLAALAAADLVFLAGGDPLLGWRTYVKHGLDRRIHRRFQQGALLVGLSAGAMQLGLGVPSPDGDDVATFGLLPYLIDVHREPDWQQLGTRIRAASSPRIGLGIPSGGGLMAHPDGRLEALAQPVERLQLEAGRLQRTNLLANSAHSP